MARRLNRRVTIQTTTAGMTGADGGLTGGVASFKLLGEGPPFIDAYVVALGADGRTVPAAGTWLAGSTLRWTGPRFGGNHVAVLQRPVIWSAATYSLRYGAAHRDRRNDPLSQIVGPWITSPPWYQLVAIYGTVSGRVVTGGANLDVTGVVAAADSQGFDAWAEITEQYSNQVDERIGSTTVTRITSISTWRMRRDDRIRPFATLIDGDDAWSVVGTRRLLDRGSLMEVECQRELQT